MLPSYPVAKYGAQCSVDPYRHDAGDGLRADCVTSLAHGHGQHPDHAGVQGGMDYIPWLLTHWKAAGHPVDVLSVHSYPQGGEFGDDVSPAMQRRRNRSTRELWDPAYVSESWIAGPVGLIGRPREWVAGM